MKNQEVKHSTARREGPGKPPMGGTHQGPAQEDRGDTARADPPRKRDRRLKEGADREKTHPPNIGGMSRLSPDFYNIATGGAVRPAARRKI